MSTYRIQRGDTLSQLAQKHGTTVSALAKANNISNPDLIITGKSLQIPDGMDKGGAAPGGAAPTASPTGGTRAPGAAADPHAGHNHPEGQVTSSSTPPGGGIHAGKGWGGSEGVADA